MRKWLLLCLSIFLLSRSLAAQASHSTKARPPQPISEADFAEHAGQYVVQVVVHVEHDKTLPDSLSPQIRECFQSHRCIAGTGVFVDDAGSLITAAHVAQAVESLVGILNSSGIRAVLEVGVSVPNYEDPQLHVSGVVTHFPATVTAIDPLHDVALLHVSVAMTMPRIVSRPGKPDIPKNRPTAAKFAIKRPRDTDPVFACGYPIYSRVLVTTTGTIASAWNSENILTAKAAGREIPIEVYEADLRINPGNSGGPVFRMSDGAVIGTSVETGPAGQGSVGLTIIIPSKYLTEFMTQHGINWVSAEGASAK